MNDEFNNIKNKVLLYLNKGIQLEMQSIQKELDDYILEEGFYENLNKWYKDFCELRILENFTDYEEICFQSSSLVYVKKENQKDLYPLAMTALDYEILVKSILHQTGASLNTESPFCSFKYLHFRITLLHPFITEGKEYKLYLRTHQNKLIGLNQFTSCEQVTMLQGLLDAKKNILIAGETGSGKTTLLSTLISMAEENDHYAILEDTQEILCHHPYSTRLITKGSQKTSLLAYMSYAMRITPDRIIIGELRSHEVCAYVLSMNTGHCGVLSTIHANSAKDAIDRVSLLFDLYSENSSLSYEQTHKFVSKNIDYIIYVKNKKITEVVEIIGSDEAQLYYEIVA
jgi:type IV secretion system protein VirB11